MLWIMNESKSFGFDNFTYIMIQCIYNIEVITSFVGIFPPQMLVERKYSLVMLIPSPEEAGGISRHLLD